MISLNNNYRSLIVQKWMGIKQIMLLTIRFQFINFLKNNNLSHYGPCHMQKKTSKKCNFYCKPITATAIHRLNTTNHDKYKRYRRGEVCHEVIDKFRSFCACPSHSHQLHCDRRRWKAMGVQWLVFSITYSLRMSNLLNMRRDGMGSDRIVNDSNVNTKLIGIYSQHPQ